MAAEYAVSTTAIREMQELASQLPKRGLPGFDLTLFKLVAPDYHTPVRQDLPFKDADPEVIAGALDVLEANVFGYGLHYASVTNASAAEAYEKAQTAKINN